MLCLGVDRHFAGQCLFMLLLLSHLLAVDAIQSPKAPFVLDFSVQPRPATAQHGKLSRRAVPDPVTANTSALISAGNPVGFVTNVTVGTPPQTVSMAVDTNSADLLFIDFNNPVCNSSNGPCDTGVYQPSSSSSYKFLNSNFSSTFGSGETAMGDYASDTLSIGGLTIAQQQLAVSRNGTLNENILGIGYIGLESTSPQYANLPITLYNDNTTNIVGYSIWFDAADSFTGGVAFGGVDTGRFNGTLETLPISMAQLSYNYVTIKLAEVTVSTGGGVMNISNSTANVVADSGTTGLYFVQGVANDIAIALGASFDNTSSAYTIPYAQMKNDSTVDLTFGGTVIEIPFSDLTIPYNETDAFVLVFSNAGSGINIVGVPFFRNAYTVFDYSHNQVSLAPVVYSSESNITLIGENGVTGLTSTARQPGSSASSSSGGLSSDAKIGIGVGVGVGVPILIALAAALFFWQRRNKATAATDGETTAEEQFGKSELPSDGRASNREELEGKDTTPAAELGGRQAVPPQELPASMPEPKELPADQPAEHSSSAVSGAGSTPVGSTSVDSPSPLIGRR